MTFVDSTSRGNEASPIVTGKSTAFKIPTFDGSGPWKQYHKQSETAVARNQRTDTEKAVVLIHLKAPAQHVKSCRSYKLDVCYRVKFSVT